MIQDHFEETIVKTHYKNLICIFHRPILTTLDSISKLILKGDYIQALSFLDEVITRASFFVKNSQLSAELTELKNALLNYKEGNYWSSEDIYDSLLKIFTLYHEIMYWDILIKPIHYQQIYTLSRSIFEIDTYGKPIETLICNEKFTQEKYDSLEHLRQIFAKDTQLHHLKTQCSYLKREVRKVMSEKAQAYTNIREMSIRLFRDECWIFFNLMNT